MITWSTTAKFPAATLPPGLLELLGQPESTPEPGGGSITNHNLRVRFGGRDVVVRLAGKDTGLLGIDRACEREATAAAAAVGVGPEVVAFLDDPPTLVTEFLPGRVMTADDLGKPDMIAEVAVTLWEIHGMLRAAAQPLLGLGRGRPLCAHRRRARRRLARHVR